MCTHYFSDEMLWWYFKQEWKNNWDHSHFNQFQMTASTVLIQQVPFSFSRYRSPPYILMSRYILFKFALPFSLARTYKRLAQPYRGFLRLCRYSKTFLRTFLPLSPLSRCLVHAMPPEQTKIEHLPRDASAILRERYLAGTFSVVTQCKLASSCAGLGASLLWLYNTVWFTVNKRDEHQSVWRNIYHKIYIVAMHNNTM